MKQLSHVQIRVQPNGQIVFSKPRITDRYSEVGCMSNCIALQLDTPSGQDHDARVGGTIMDVVVWLRSLGLGKYEAAFRENDIDDTGPGRGRIAKSPPYCASPVTFGTPSGRTGRVPTHLNCFAASREVMSSTATSPDCRVARNFAKALRGRHANASASAIGLTMRSRPTIALRALDRQPMLD